MGGYKITRLSVEKTDKNLKKHLEDVENEDISSKGEMVKLKNKVVAKARLSTGHNNNFSVSRNSKRRMPEFSATSTNETPKMVEKRPKFAENRTSTPQNAAQGVPPPQRPICV